MMDRKKASPAATVSPGEGKRGISRRTFLKGTAGFVLLCGSGFGLLRALAETADVPEEKNEALGPLIRQELEIVKTADGAEVLYGGETCFKVNGDGLKLLEMADGKKTLGEIIRLSGMAEDPEPVVDFFLTLGEAGYLTHRLEVNKVASVV